MRVRCTAEKLSCTTSCEAALLHQNIRDLKVGQARPIFLASPGSSCYVSVFGKHGLGSQREQRGANEATSHEKVKGYYVP